MADDINRNLEDALNEIINRNRGDFQDRLLNELSNQEALFQSVQNDLLRTNKQYYDLLKSSYDKQYDEFTNIIEDQKKFAIDLNNLQIQNRTIQKKYTTEVINNQINSLKESLNVLDSAKKDALNKQLISQLEEVAKAGGNATEDQIREMAKTQKELNDLAKKSIDARVNEARKYIEMTAAERLTKAKQDRAEAFEKQFEAIDDQIAQIYEQNKGKAWTQDEFEKITALEEKRKQLQNENAKYDYDNRKKYIISEEDLKREQEERVLQFKYNLDRRYRTMMEDIAQEREERNANRQFELRKKYATYLQDLGTQIAENVGNHLVQILDKTADIFLFNGLQRGISNYAQQYEANFTEIAGRLGSQLRSETNDFIVSTLQTVHGDPALNKGLNFNNDVFPQITQAVKNGFQGQEAQDIAISNAVDHKIMPWLETTNETWTNLQYQLGNDNLESLKGQQLLLQESREGNRLLQTGIIDSLTQTLEPTLLNIEANTTDTTQMSAEAQAIYSFLREQGNYSKQDALKLTNDVIDAYANPMKAIDKGGVSGVLMGAESLRPDATYDSIFQAGVMNLVQQTRGMNRGESYFALDAFGLPTNGWTRDDKLAQNLLNPDISLNEYIQKYSTTSAGGRQLYNNVVNNLAQYNSATAEANNKIENQAAIIASAFGTLPHGFEVLNMMYDEVKSIKDWLIRTFVGGIVRDGISWITSGGGNPLRMFGAGGGGGGTGGLGGSGGTGGGGLLGRAGTWLTDRLGGGFLTNQISNMGGVGSRLAGMTGRLGFMESGAGAAVGSAVGLTAAALETKAGIDAIQEGAAGLSDKTNSDVQKTKAGWDLGTGVAATAGGVIGGGALLALGASNPVGWVALAAGGLALGIKKVADHFAELDDATALVSKNFDESKQAIEDEMNARNDQLFALKDSMNQLKTTDEKLEYLRQNGLDPQIDSTKDVNAQLTEYINNLIGANDALSMESQNLIDDVAAEYKNQFNDQVDDVKNAILDAYSKEALEAKGFEGDAIWDEQRKALVKLGYNDEEINKIYTHWKNGAMSRNEFAGVLNSGAVDGKNIGSWEDMIEKDRVEGYKINYLLEQAGSKIHYTDSNEVSMLAKDFAPAVRYLYTHKEYGRSDNKVTSNVPDDFNQQRYDEYKQTILSAGSDSEGLLKLLFEQAGDSEAMSDWPNSLKGYKLGSTFIDNDQLALLHKGERVLTQAQNTVYSKLTSGGLSSLLNPGGVTDLLLNLISGDTDINKSLNSSAVSDNIIESSVQGVVSAIEKQTQDIISYFSNNNNNSASGMSIAKLLESFGNSSILPSMGNIKILADG